VTPFLLRRLLHALTVVFLVTTVTFVIVHAAPGGPAILADPKLGPVERAEIEARLGLDRPLPVQYAAWMGSVVRGDLGRSFLYQTPNVETILQRLPNTLLLAGSALVLTLVLALPLGLYAAARPGSMADRVLATCSFVSMAIPTFWLAIAMIFVFAVLWRVLPAGGAATLGREGSIADRLSHLLLPAVVLSAASAAELFRYMRSSTRSVLNQPFVRTARAKGVGDTAVRWRHAARNALLPVITVIGLQLPRLVGGAAITETVFAWPGMGRLGVEAALGRDYPLVMAITLFVAAGVALVNIVIDLCYVWADPRVRLET
jgi:peptide/nickel transport system permease protein